MVGGWTQEPIEVVGGGGEEIALPVAEQGHTADSMGQT